VAEHAPGAGPAHDHRLRGPGGGRAVGIGSLVCIGLPTYNRAGTLPRAIESALAQTHREIELVISDNASQDGTEAIARRYAERDDRVRYVRQPVNAGPTANFNALFEECRGDYALMLADDDWLDADYVETCLRELRRSPDHALVCGLARYYRNGEHVTDGEEVQVPEADGPGRVRSYLRQVDDNGTFYGLMPGEVLRQVGPMCNDLGNDWFHVAAISFLGKIRTLRETHVNRDLGGTSDTLESISRTFGVDSRLQRRLPHVYMAGYAFRDVAVRSPVYRALGPAGRLRLACAAAPLVLNWRSMAWHLVAPSMAALRGRPRGRPVYRAFLRLTRRLGAGRSRLG
jgi:glycosyltransferase involved in cell wall biosynthesis